MLGPEPLLMALKTDKRGSHRTAYFTAVYISHPEDGAREEIDREEEWEWERKGGVQKYAAAESLHLNLTLLCCRKFMKEWESE